MKYEALVIAVLAVGSVQAQPTQEERILNAVKYISDAKERQCLAATGSIRFCGCLHDNLPVIFDFTDYVTIVTGTLDESKYRKASEVTRLAVDKTFAARDVCTRG
jgi:hypothetical protein